jgi:hypothetical protein
VLLHGVLTHIARHRGANSAELEDFVSGFTMKPLPGSPFVVSLRGDEGSRSTRRKQTR